LHRDQRYLFEQLMMDCAMHTNMTLQAKAAKKPKPDMPVLVWIGGTVARSVFLIILTVLTARVASPQVENLQSLFETPGDLIRVALGFAVCAWLVVNLFIVPKDAEAYRSWMYLSLVLVPLSLLCAFVVW
jgi:hypothetical protein